MANKKYRILVYDTRKRKRLVARFNTWKGLNNWLTLQKKVRKWNGLEVLDFWVAETRGEIPVGMDRISRTIGPLNRDQIYIAFRFLSSKEQVFK